MAKVFWWMLAGVLAFTLSGVVRADCCDECEGCCTDAKCACEKDKGTCSCKTKSDEKCACEKEDGSCPCKKGKGFVKATGGCPCVPSVAWVVWKMLNSDDGCCANGTCTCPFSAKHNEGDAKKAKGCCGGMCPMMKSADCAFNPMMALPPPPPPIPGLPPLPGMPPIAPPFTPSLQLPQMAMPMMPPMPPQFAPVAMPGPPMPHPVVRCVALTTAVKPVHHCVLRMKAEDGEIRMVVDNEGKACVTCSKMTLKLGDSHEMHVFVTDDKLSVEGEGVEASAEKLSWSKEEGLVVLEGKVEFSYVKDGKHVDAGADKIVVGLRDGHIEVDPK